MNQTHDTKSYFSDNYRSYSEQNPPKKLDHYISILSEFSSLKEPSVLDIGCGLGSFLQRASQQRPSWKLYGADMRQEAIDGSRAVVDRRIQLTIASATERPFPEVEFDLITAWDVLEHVEELDSALAVIEEMLTEFGRLVMVVPVYDGLTGPAIRWLDKDPTHVHKLARYQWLDIVSERFEVLDWHGILRYLLPGGRYVHLTTTRFRRFTPAILLIGQRRAELN